MRIAALRAPGPTRADASTPDRKHYTHSVAIPPYLTQHYWWAYIDQRAIRFFDRQWMINLILWGNYGRLRDGALDALGGHLAGQTLQVACAYGDLTPRLCERVSDGGGRLDIVDVVPAQLDNVRRKLPPDAPVRLLNMDASDLSLPTAGYDRAIVYLLFHEQPENYRQRTLSEIFRVVKPGGRIVIIDYARPCWWNPVRYVLGLVLATLEPFAFDLWRHELATWMPKPWAERPLDRELLFGGVYQKIVITR